MTAISEAVTTGASSARRRSAVIAASSGLVVTMGLPTAAAPLVDQLEEPAGPSTTQSIPVVPSVTATEGVAVPQDAQVDFALSALTTVDSAQAEADAAAEAAVRAEREAAATRASRADASSRAAARAVPPLVGDAQEAVDAAGSSASAAAGSVLEVGSRYIGTPYRYGGTSPSGFDCSGFVQYVYEQLGVSLPRTASAQARAGARVSASEARPGDIVSFTGPGGIYHNGIYAGDGKMLDAPRSGKSVAVRDIWSSSVTFTRVG